MRRSLRIRFTLAAVFVLSCFPSCGLAQTSTIAPRNRIVSPIVDSDAITLAGNVHPLARPEFDRGLLAEETRLDRIMLLLKPSADQQRGLDVLTQAQQNPSSPFYHQWLAPEDYGSRFGVSAADLARVISWLRVRGFTVEPVPAGHTTILFSGTAGQIADAFHTEIHAYEVGGRMHIANVLDPQIPSALAPVVAGVLSLHDFRRTSAMRFIREVARPENTQGSTHYLFPADFATIYDLNPQYTAGRTGSGASIAIVGRSNINLSDVSNFRSGSALIANQPTVILEGANPGLVAGDQDESTLDVEWSGAVAPGAAVRFVIAESTSTTDGVDLSAHYIVNNKTATVMSTSYGSCEAEMGSSELAFYNSLWQQAASEGITSFVASGDSGAAGCNPASSSSGSMAGVNGLCSSPYSTCVGGTEFNEGSGSYWSASNGAGGGPALSYIPEKVWNESANDGGSGLWASTGGISEAYTQPVWQKGVSGANSNGMRAVPDVAMTAASHDGYLIYENGSWYVIGGTSAASPSFAGVMAIVNQKQGGDGQGNTNPTLYGMLDASHNPFHATPIGNNSVPGLNGYAASGAAYNLATGLGSVDASLLVNEWPGSGTGTTPPGFTLKPSAAGQSLLQGQSTTFTVAISATGGFSGAVALSPKTPAGVTLSCNPASVKAGASTTATLTVASSAPVGTSNITITGSSGSITATTTIALTVLATPTLTIAESATKVTVAQGEAGTLQVTASTGGSFSGAVSLSVRGLPAGVSATWTNGSYSSNVNGSTTSMLTLRTSSSTPLAVTTLAVTATGDGLTASATASLLVTSSPAITATLSPAAIIMKSTASQAVTVTINPIGGVKPTASGSSFQIAGLPTGFTAIWGTPVLTAAGSLQVALNLVGSSSAITSASKPTVTVQVHDSTTGIFYTASEQATLTVMRSNSLAVSAAASALSVPRGKSTTNVMTISTANNFYTAVSLSVSGLPQGVSATWSADPVTPDASSGQASATLTLRAAPASPLAAATVEGRLRLLGNRSMRLRQRVVNLQHAGRRLGQRLQGLHRLSPVDGAIARPKMLVSHRVIVVHMHRSNAIAQRADGVLHAYRHVRMAYIQASPNAGEMALGIDLHQVLGRGRLADQVFRQQANSKRLRKSIQMLKRGQSMLQAARRPGVGSLAQVHHQIFKVKMLGCFKRALDLVHGIDAARLFRMQQVDRWCSRAAHLAVRIERRVHRPALQRIGGKPAGQLLHMLAAGVVEVLACGKDLHRLGSAARGQFQQPGMQPLLQEQVRR
jgi:pseudomonalisin